MKLEINLGENRNFNSISHATNVENEKLENFQCTETKEIFVVKFEF